MPKVQKAISDGVRGGNACPTKTDSPDAKNSSTKVVESELFREWSIKDLKCPQLKESVRESNVEKYKDIRERLKYPAKP